MGGSQRIIWMRDQTVLDGNLDVIWLISWLAFWLKAETLAGLVHGVCSTCTAGGKLRKYRCLRDCHQSNQYVFFVNAADILAQILGEHAVFSQFSLRQSSAYCGTLIMMILVQLKTIKYHKSSDESHRLFLSYLLFTCSSQNVKNTHWKHQKIVCECK